MSTEIYESLYRISQLFNSILEPELLLEQVLDEAIKSVRAERGLLVLSDEKTGALEVKAARGVDRAIEKELSEVSQTALKEVLTKREGRIYLDARSAFPAAQSVIIGQVRSIACVPLVGKGRLIGAIYVDSRTDKNVFREDTLKFLEAFAGVAALAIENARLYQTLASESGQLRAAMREWQQFPEIVGRSPAMQTVYELMNRVIPSDVPVLITGETGTGKELVARAVHYGGPRRDQPFVALNCGGIPENLLESELFGYRKGAFTGAVTDKRGLLETANGGTVFLDEISDLPLLLQPKLLRVLQSGEVRRVGDTTDFRIEVRVISATNQNLAALVRERKFREDLYYRLNVVPIELPPLRARREDVPLLVSHFLKQCAERQQKPIAGIEQAALSRLLQHSWPGNIRELENVIERATVLSAGPRITEADIMLAPAQSDALTAEGSVAEIEKRVVLERLKRFNGNRTRTAASLGISRRTLLNKLAEWKQDEEPKE
jgi:Nif-specific regulatory protein